MQLKNIFKEAVVISFLFLALQILYKIYLVSTGFALKNDSINFDIYLDALKQSSSLQYDVAHFISAQFFIIIVLRLIVIACTYGATHLFSYARDNTRQIFRLFWLYALGSLLVLNARYYPQSDYAIYYTHIFESAVMSLLMWITLATLTFFMMVFLLNTIIKNPNKAVTAMSCLIVIFAVYKLIPEHPYNHHSQPNVVIIGIDSLRPDVLQDAGNVAPFIKSMVEENTTYQNTYTPLARTFPAWISILTGRYPSSTEIRVNLQSPEQIKQPVSLGHFLQDQGYTTIYATDEKRFSNIDESYGFDKTIGPEIGIHDFLFSHFSDFPLSNLISDWRISQYLFPYTYANRAADRLYNPDTFVDLSLREIKDTVSTGKPFFIAAHFCLPHWPYTWKGYVPTDNHKENYLATVQRVDQQVKDFMLGLEQAAMLENTIIVLLSDHGETFAEKDRVDNQKIALKNFSSPHFDYSHHHGNDLASINQNKVLLTFIDNTIRQDFSKKLQPNWLTSLIDIAPTLTNYLDDNKNHPIYQKFDGISLFEKQHHASDRSLFLETGFTASSIDDIKFSIENVIEETIDFYTVDVDTGRLQVVPDKQQNIIKTKQRGIVTQDWLLVHHPVAHGTAEITLIDLESGNTFCDHAHSGDSIHHSKQAQCISEISVQEKKIANHLLSQLRAFYGNEIQL